MESSITQNKFYDINDIEQLRFALDNIPVYLYIKDKDSRYIYANKITLDLFGCSSDELRGRGDCYFFPPETVEYLREIDLRVLGGESTQEEVAIGNPESGQRVYLEVKTPIYDKSDTDTVVAILGISTDITYQKQIENEVRSLALTDPLTHLPNRRLLFERIGHAQSRSKRHNTHCAVLFVDLNRFKQVNDLYGHSIGDLLLIEVASRLRSQVRDTDTVARVGGDEFIVLLDEVGSKRKQSIDYTREIAERINRKLSETYSLGDIQLNTSASIGINVFIGDEYSTSKIISIADERMYQNKQEYYHSMC